MLGGDRRNRSLLWQRVASDFFAESQVKSRVGQWSQPRAPLAGARTRVALCMEGQAEAPQGLV